MQTITVQLTVEVARGRAEKRAAADECDLPVAARRVALDAIEAANLEKNPAAKAKSKSK